MRKLKKSGEPEALLTNLIRLTGRKEDFVTEVFAGLLQSHPTVAHAFLQRLIPGRSVSGAPVQVTTQRTLVGWRSRPDMLVSTAGLRIAVEHKIGAPEGPGQLRKYLALPARHVSHVALISADYCRLAPTVIANVRYLRPQDGRLHFIWSDMWPVVQLACRLRLPLAESARRLFADLGFQPVHRLVPNLHDPDPARALRNDRQMSEIFDPLRRSLVRRRFSWRPSIRKTRSSEIYIRPPDSSPICVAWLDPFSSPSHLLLRLRFATRASRDRVAARLEERRTWIPVGPLVSITTEKRSARNCPWAINLRVPWHPLLANCRNRASMSRAIKRLTLRTLSAAAARRARPN